MEILPRFKIQYPMKNRDKYTPLLGYRIYPIRGIFRLFLIWGYKKWEG
jgi:hypothetical protein